MKGQEDVLISIPKSEDSDDGFENLSITRRRIAQIQADIFNIIDRLQDNQSMITRAANYWGEQPGWKKISTGIFMVTSLLSLGIIAHGSLLITLSVVTAVGYFGGGAVLDDHYQSGQRSKINLKEGITSLTNMLGTIMEALDEACTQLKEEIGKLNTEVSKLKEAIGTLEVENEKFSKNLEELEELQKAFVQTQLELQGVKTSMGLEVEGLRGIVSTLEGTVRGLVGNVLPDAEKRKEFIARFEQYITDGTKTFAQYSEKFQENNKRYEDLLVVQERDRLLFKTTLAELSSRYNQLLIEQGKQVDRLEKVADSHEAIFPRPLLYSTPSKFSRSKRWPFFDAHAINDYLDFADTSDESLVSCARV